MIDMNVPVIFQFLKEPSASNNREWFNIHREQHENVRSEFKDLLTVIISRTSSLDESIHGIEAKDCTCRIHRDTRFLEDKTSYKNHLSGYVNAKGKKSGHCGYHIHPQPGNCLLAGDSYCPPSPLLKALRQAVYNNIDEFRGIVEDLVFKQYFPVAGENFPKIAPKGFLKGYLCLKYLQCKECTVACSQPDSFFLAPNFLGRTDDILKRMRRFSDFVNCTIDDFE